MLSWGRTILALTLSGPDRRPSCHAAEGRGILDNGADLDPARPGPFDVIGREGPFAAVETAPSEVGVARRGGWVTVAVILGAVGGGRDVAHAGSPRSTAPPSGTRTAVTGTIVDKEARPIAGQLVREGGHRAQTDTDGRFTLPDVPGRYDLTILTPDQGRVTISPRPFAPRSDAVPRPRQAPRSSAQGPQREGLGRAVGGGPYPLRSTTSVRFVSARAGAEVRIGGNGSSGPAWGPIEIAWDGPDTIWAS